MVKWQQNCCRLILANQPIDWWTSGFNSSFLLSVINVCMMVTCSLAQEIWPFMLFMLNSTDFLCLPWIRSLYYLVLAAAEPTTLPTGLLLQTLVNRSLNSSDSEVFPLLTRRSLPFSFLLFSSSCGELPPPAGGPRLGLGLPPHQTTERGPAGQWTAGRQAHQIRGRGDPCRHSGLGLVGS